MLRWCTLGAIGCGSGLVLCTLCAYAAGLVRVRRLGLTWLGLKATHVVLLACSYLCGAYYIWQSVYHSYAAHGAPHGLAVLALVYGLLGITGQAAILAYARRGGSVGAYALTPPERGKP